MEDTTHIAEEEVEADEPEEEVEGEEEDDLVLEEDDDGEADARMHQAESEGGVDSVEKEQGIDGEEEQDDEGDEDEPLGELLDVSQVPEGEGDPSLIPADEPLDLEDTAADPAALSGDALRRPAGRQGLEAIKREREKLGRQAWEEDVRDGRARGRRGRAVRIR